MPQYKRLPLACFGVLLVWISPVPAATITFDATDSGWYRSTDGFHQPANQNFFVGADSNAVAEFRNFFVFDLASQAVSGNILSVTLRVENVPLDNTAGSPDGGEFYEVFGFGGTLADLTGGTSSFGDLGSGTSFGMSGAVSAADAQLVDILFNASGRTVVGLGLGGFFAVTGLINSIGDGSFLTDGEDLFEGPNSSNVGATTRQLIIETDAVVIPEPSTIFLFGAGLAGLAGLARRRLG